MTMLATPAGPVLLRPETAADMPFRLQLFAASRQPEWALFPPGPMLDQLMQMQFAAQNISYKARFPNGSLQIIELAGAPAGRLATDISAQAVTLVDIALLPDHRSSGIGTAIIAALQTSARQASIPLLLHVADGNEAAHRLYQRLGFVADGPADTHVAMRWPAP